MTPTSPAVVRRDLRREGEPARIDGMASKPRSSTKSKTKSAADPAKPKRQPQACTCGCGEETKGGRYKPGHDARHKGALLTKLREGNARERESAEKQLRAAGWEQFIPV